MTLYEIDKCLSEAIEEFYKFAEENEGEVNESLESLINNLEIEKYIKVENVALFVKNLNTEAEGIKAEENALRSRRQVIENKLKRLKNYLNDSLSGEKFKTSKVSISYRNSESVIVDDIDKIPESCKRIKVEPDKIELKKILKNRDVEGAKLVSKQSIIII